MTKYQLELVALYIQDDPKWYTEWVKLTEEEKEECSLYIRQVLDLMRDG